MFDADDPGRALPDEVLDILDRNIALLRPATTAQYRVQGWSNDDYGLLRQTIYQLLRDTRRRPGDRSELIARSADLEILVTKLRTHNTELLDTNARLTQLVDQQRDDLDSANTLLRRYMKEASRAQSAAPS
jgi:hypothetical protein